GLAREPRRDDAFDADNILIAQLAGRVLKLGTRLGLEDDLGQARAIAYVDEREPPKVAPGVDPAVEDDGLTHVFERQFAAGVCPFEHGYRRVWSAAPFGDGEEYGGTASLMMIRGFTLPHLPVEHQAFVDP